MPINLDNFFARAMREDTLPFKIGIGGSAKVRELKALRMLYETPYMATPEDQKYLSSLGHAEVTKYGMRFSPRGRQRLAELENMVKSVLPQENPAPAVGALPGDVSALRVLPQPGSGLPTNLMPNVYRGALPQHGLPDPNDPDAWLRKT